jgi:phosphoenolpyruvate synthase/pyruvate phosphate dikinase
VTPGLPLSAKSVLAKGMPLVAPLDALSRTRVDRAGGKGANLGELRRAGFPVPPGFVLTTAPYERFLGDSGRLARLPTAPAAPNVEAGGALHQAFLGAPLADEIATAAGAAYRALGGGAVAVRSSATDLPRATFAGQQETFLGLPGEAARWLLGRSAHGRASSRQPGRRQPSPLPLPRRAPLARPLPPP